MAGIGFTLERLAHGRTLSSVAAAYVYAAALVAGPWIFTVLGVAGISFAACTTACDDLQVFRSIIIYNSVFSLIWSSPIAFVATRFVSDQIYVGKNQHVMFALVVSLGVFALGAFAVGIPFYTFATTLSGLEKILGLQKLVLIGSSWLLIPFVGAIRGARTVALAFAAGAAIMVGAVALDGGSRPAVLLGAFNLGLSLIVFVLVLRLTAEFSIRIVPSAELWRTAVRNWELIAIGMSYGVGLWIDKFVMWIAAPLGTVRAAGGFQTMPNYDTPMFWAQLAAIPVIAVFFVHVETNFYRLCRDFYPRLDQKASLRELQAAIAKLSRFVLFSLAGLFISLVAICILAILMSLVAVDPLGLQASQMGVLRSGLVGMACHTTAMFCFIFFLYFDLKRQALLISLTQLVLSGSLTALLLPLGLRVYGYGFMLASAVTLMVGVGLLMKELPWLHYHAFVTNNGSLRNLP